MHIDPEGTLWIVTIIAITLLAGGIAAVIGQILANTLNGNPLQSSIDVAFTKGVISTGVSLLLKSPIAGVFTYGILTQTVNYTTRGNINASEFIIDVMLGLITVGITNSIKIKINPGWLTNLKFSNIFSNIFEGKVVKYAISNFIMEVGVDGSVTVFEYIEKQIHDIFKREDSCPLMPYPIQFN